MDVGGRLTGRVGRFSAGVMNIQTGDLPDIGAQRTNFTVARCTQASFRLGQQRLLAGTVSLQQGSFFSGDKTTVGFTRGRLELTPQLSVEPSVSYNRVDLPEGRFTTTLVTTRTTYTVTPLMFVSGLLQYNSSSHALSTNVRLRWEYQPGSELYVVYNEQRDTLAPHPVARAGEPRVHRQDQPTLQVLSHVA